jgi:hypothetical protein
MKSSDFTLRIFSIINVILIITCFILDPKVNVSREKRENPQLNLSMNEFDNWIYKDSLMGLKNNQFYVLYILDNSLHVISTDGKYDVQISKREVFFGSQISYDGKIIALFSQDEYPVIDLSGMKSFDYKNCQSVECFGRGNSIPLGWSVDFGGENKREIQFTNKFNKQQRFTVDMPREYNDFPLWSYDGSQMALVQADLDRMNENQPGSFYFLDTSCLGLENPCQPKISRSFTLENYPMWCGITATWSADNEFLAFVNINMPEDIVLLDSNNNFRKIPNNQNEIIRRIFWSPDGRHLLIQQAADIKIMNISTGEETILLSESSAEPIGWFSTFAAPIFKVGNSLQVSGAGKGMGVHTDPNQESQILRKLSTDDTVYLIDGPINHGKEIWWEIQLEKERSQGWVLQKNDWFVMRK